MKQAFKVEVKFNKGSVVNYFDNKQQAEDYALISAGFGSGKYQITQVYLNEGQGENNG